MADAVTLETVDTQNKSDKKEDETSAPKTCSGEPSVQV